METGVSVLIPIRKRSEYLFREVMVCHSTNFRVSEKHNLTDKSTNW